MRNKLEAHAIQAMCEVANDDLVVASDYKQAGNSFKISSQPSYELERLG